MFFNLSKLFLWLFMVCVSALSISVTASAWNFWTVMGESIDTNNNGVIENGWLTKKLQKRDITDKWAWVSVKELVAFIAIKILLPIAVLTGLVFAFIGFYKVMTSNSEEESKKGTKYLLRGTIGVIVMVSAAFIVNELVGIGDLLTGDNAGTKGIFWSISGDTVAWQVIAAKIYTQLLFPVIKMLMFIIIGILFVILFINLFKYLFSPAEDITKKALTIIIWNTIGILTIILAKYFVETIFGKYDTVTNEDRFNTAKNSIWWIYEGWGTNLWTIGTPIGDIIVNLGKFYTVLNWLLGLLTLIILVLIIYQGLKLLFNPSDSSTLGSVGKTLFYIFLGILVLGLWYIIASAIIPVT